MFVGTFKVITSFTWVLDVDSCILRSEDQVVLVTNVAAPVN